MNVRFFVPLRLATSAILTVIVLQCWAASESRAASPRDAQWKQVEDAIKKGLPKTAIEALTPIIRDALAEKAYGEAAKAITRRIVLEGNIQGNKPEEKIARMQAEIERAPEELVPVFETILAHWYWHYFQNNRWRFVRRTTTADVPGGDFTTWDLRRLFAEIDLHFTRALASFVRLQQIPIETFDDLLEKGTLPDKLRPTLYDFVAHEALKFYTSAEQAGAKAEDDFEIFADQPVSGVIPVFGDAEEFLAGKIERRSNESPKEKALFLFRDLLSFHRADADPSAFLHADLERLSWAFNSAVGEDKNTRYRSALERFVKKWADHELSAQALYALADSLRRDGKLQEAHATAQRAVSVFPEGIGGRLCQNLLADIEAKSASITTERVWNAPWPKISVHYRNVEKVYFRAVAYDWELFLDKRRSRPESLNEVERRELMSKPPILEWSEMLPATADFKERTQVFSGPTNLNPGFYFLLASHEPTFRENLGPLSFADIWVSDLALVIRPRNGRIEGFLLEAAAGEPINGAEIMAWRLDEQGNRRPIEALQTDTNGFFSFEPAQQRGYLIRARHHGHELASSQEYWAYPNQQPNAQEQTVFFTDRALYRPGQTIQFKGICLRSDQESDNYTTLAGRKLKVALTDANGQQIAQADFECNDYGSFSGSFLAPKDRLLGQMNLQVTSGPPGFGNVRVEEYKRPKFEVVIDSPRSPAKLNETVAVEGRAMAYTGAAIDGASVKFRVVREVQWPYWWSWFGRAARSGSGSQEIAHGSTTTRADGTFRLEFPARPDSAVAEGEGAFFRFAIHADVTDSAGETRSDDRTVSVGFAALQTVVTADDWQTDERPVELAVSTTSLDGEPQAAEGTLRVHLLKSPPQVVRASLHGFSIPFRNGPIAESELDASDPNSWELGEAIFTQPFSTDAQGKTKITVPLEVGLYRVVTEAKDSFGKIITGRLPLRVLRPTDTRLALKIPQLLAAPRWSLEPGQDFLALWGTGYEAGRAFVEIEHRNQLIARFWTQTNQTQQKIQQAVDEKMRGGFTLHITQVRENRAYLSSGHVDVPWSNKELDLRWEHFSSKLEPAQKETWTLVVSQSKTNASVTNLTRAVAELVATLYDESLDQFQPHHWMSRFGVFRYDHSSASPGFLNSAQSFRPLAGSWTYPQVPVNIRYRQFPADLIANFWGFQFARRAVNALGNEAMLSAMAPPAPMSAAAADAGVTRTGAPKADEEAAKEVRQDSPGENAAAPKPDLSQIVARRNLNETAFFFPQTTTDSNGVFRLTFTMPEALTRWRFFGFAHDPLLRSGFIEGHAVTAKDLMVQPNPPRFLREGDELEFTVKVLNQSDRPQRGRVRLTFVDANQGKPADTLLQNAQPEVEFDLASRTSRSYAWRIRVPDGAPFLRYTAVAASEKVSDGEEGVLPVLSRRVFVSESLPLPIRGVVGAPVTKGFKFEKLLNSDRSTTLQHLGVTVQMVSNPAWYAVMALPFLMEFPYECTEQTFNRFYANALARQIANSDPKIRRVFDQWKATAALESPLEKNSSLKTVMLEETPWVRDALNETQARRNVGILFESERLDRETTSILRQLTEMQLADGSWPWFPGGRRNDFITLYVATGFGRLRQLGADLDVAPALRAWNRLDLWMDEQYRQIQKGNRAEDYVPGPTDALYLYGRSFFLKDRPVAPEQREAVNFFLGQARKHWLKVSDRQTQGYLALALRRFNASTGVPDATSTDIMRSLKERSVTSEEMGMFWRETELGWWWYRAPIETQALMIEAFDEVTGDSQAVEECRVWLLKQKQTQDWKTTKATADAIYALLLRGRDILASDTLVEVKMAGTSVTPPTSARDAGVEAGTGFFEKRFPPSAVHARLGEITVTKSDPGVAWGSVHWQYLEDIEKVTPHTGTPLTLSKRLFTKINSKAGPQLDPVSRAVKVGDELVVRLELRVDRDMEYVHLKDERGSGTEPVDVLSGYRYQDGLAYYSTTRDTANHFFIDYLPKGTYVFEYSTRVVHRGSYQTGRAEIQCLYAPEFNSHSGSVALNVQ